MKIRDLFSKWGLSQLKLKASFLEATFEPDDHDKDAAWELYVELLTRIATQPLKDEEGDEKTALESVYSLFATTRSILKRYKKGMNFAKISIIVLNQIIRPFTAKWHRESTQNAFTDQSKCQDFRTELKILQKVLRQYMHLLAEMANVEDITALEEPCT